MPTSPGWFTPRVSALRREHNHIIVDWVTRRIIEDMSLDVYQLKAGVERAIDRSAIVVEAAAANLGKRRWTKTLDLLVTGAAQALRDATDRKTDGPKGMPLLLKSSFSHLALLDLLGSRKARLVDANLGQELQAGLVLLGAARGEALYRTVRDAGEGALNALMSDITAAGERSLAIPPEPVEPLTAIPGGGTLNQEEQRLVGHWVNTEVLGTGTTGRFELHMVLLATRHLARTTRSVVFAPLRDSGGNWAGSLDSVSGLSRAERGRWNAADSLLTLEMDDGSAYEYWYRQEGASMSTTNTNGGARRHWTRSS